MRRSPLILKPTPEQLRTGSTLRRSQLPIARQAINAVSPRRAAENRVRKAFTADLLAMYPNCQIASPMCTGMATQVHEAIKRSQGGAIVPGAKATAQGQRFYTSCTNCNVLWVEGNPAESREKGFTISNPLRGQKL